MPLTALEPLQHKHHAAQRRGLRAAPSATPPGAPRFRVTHILLDVDGTLVDNSAASSAALAAATGRCTYLVRREVTADEVSRSRQDVNADPQWCSAPVNAIRHETMRRLLAIYGVADETATGAVLDAFEDARNQAMTVFPDVRGALAALRSLGVVLIAASNGDVDLGCVGLAQYVAGTHYAVDIGIRKPDPRFFALALSRLGIPAQAALAVGDRFDNDYAPAQAAGLRSVLLDRTGEIADPSITRITSLAELPALIARC